MIVNQLDEMKLEANWFLKKISAFNAQAHIVIDEQMVKLLYHTTQKIADCVDRSKIASDTNNNKQNVDVLFDIDESCYRYHRSIMCTICGVSIRFSVCRVFGHFVIILWCSLWRAAGQYGNKKG